MLLYKNNLKLCIFLGVIFLFNLTTYGFTFASTLNVLKSGADLVGSTEKLIKQGLKKDLKKRSSISDQQKKTFERKRQYVAKYNKWYVIIDTTDTKQKICYAIISPQARISNIPEKTDNPNYFKPYLLIYNTDISPSINTAISAGYDYKRNVFPQFKIDLSSNYNFIFKNQTAWPKTDKINHLFVKDLSLGKILIVKSISNDNYYSNDRYILIGIKKAIKELLHHCKSKI